MRAVYLDACVAICFIERHPQFFKALLQRLFLASGQPAVRWVLSELLRMECRLNPLRDGDQILLARYDAFFGTPGHAWAPLDRGAFELATRLRAEHRLKTADALHLAAALQSGCDEFWTNDNRLQAAAQGRLATFAFEEATE